MNFHFEPVPFAEASEHISRLPIVEADVFDELVPELKACVFVVKGVASIADRQELRQLLAGMPEGATWEQTKPRIIEVLQRSGFSHPKALRRAELLLRHWTGVSYAAANWRIMDQQRHLFPWWQYRSMGDGRVRATHSALDQIVLAHDSPFWETHFPPWEPMCRCQVVPLSDYDVDGIREADKDLPEEKKRVLEGPALKELLENDRLVRGLSMVHDTRTPLQRGQNWAGWNPRNIVPTKAYLKQALGQDGYKELLTWAETKAVDDGTTVADWIEGFPQGKRKPRKPKQAAPEPEPEPAPPAIPPAAELKRGKRLGGSTGAFLATSTDGRTFVVKEGASAEHLREEFAADAIYRAAGVAVPDAILDEAGTRPVKVAQRIEGKQLGEWLKTATPAEADATLRRLRQGFAVDALLGNWDVIGATADNVLVDSAGVPWRIDNGGSLRYRAQGSAKNATEWQAHPDELWTIRESAQGKSVFGNLSIQEIAAQITALDAQAILAAAPADVRPMLEARLRTMRDIANKSASMASDWQDGYTDRLCREIVNLRRAGITERLPQRLEQAPGVVVPVDENGYPFDHLRTNAGVIPGKGGDPAPAILAAVKSINHHIAQGSATPNAAKIDAALALLPDIQTKAAAGDAAAQHYLPFLTAIAQAKAGTPAPIAQFTPYAGTGAPAAPKTSIVQQLADHMAARGGDYSIISGWQRDQAGSSWSNASQAYKAFLVEQGSPAQQQLPRYWRDGQAAAAKKLAAARKRSGAATWDLSFVIHHAFVQEQLSAVEFRHNDRAAGYLRVIRTEQKAIIQTQNLSQGVPTIMVRGANESGSIFIPTTPFGDECTVQAVPHHRITGLYFSERSPGSNLSPFLGDGENEVLFCPQGLPTVWTGKGVNGCSWDAGNDSTKWEITP